LLPPLCLGCKAEARFLCDACWQATKQYPRFVCPICKKRTLDGRLDNNCRNESALTRYFGAPIPYSDERAKKLIHALKYQRVREIANTLSKILIEFLDKNGFNESIEKYRQHLVIVPVPLYNFRERERGFNQASEIGKQISRYYKIPFAQRALTKHKNTEPQADIENKEDRAKNISGAFSINWSGSDPDQLKNKIVILIDDVYTSGATMRECARTLRKGGVREVWGLTVARG